MSEFDWAPRAVTPRVNGVQTLRGVAALCVVLSHIEAIGHGIFGVDIFFVISGFVISLVGRTEAPFEFLLKRAFRIVPLYWLGTFMVFGVALLWPQFLKSSTANPAYLLKSLVFWPYNKESGAAQPLLFLGWTLNYEVFFYVIFALASRISRKRPELPATLIIVSILIFGVVAQPFSQPLQFWTAPIIAEFLYGMWLERLWSAKIIPRVPLLVAAAGSLLALGFMLLQESYSFSSQREIVLGLPAAIMMLSVLSCEGRVRWPVWALMIGDASYSLYLFHPYVIIPLQHLILRSSGFLIPGGVAVCLAGSVLAAVLLAMVCYRFLERPLNKLLRQRAFGSG